MHETTPLVKRATVRWVKILNSRKPWKLRKNHEEILAEKKYYGVSSVSHAGQAPRCRDVCATVRPTFGNFQPRFSFFILQV